MEGNLQQNFSRLPSSDMMSSGSVGSPFMIAKRSSISMQYSRALPMPHLSSARASSSPWSDKPGLAAIVTKQRS